MSDWALETHRNATANFSGPNLSAGDDKWRRWRLRVVGEVLTLQRWPPGDGVLRPGWRLSLRLDDLELPELPDDEAKAQAVPLVVACLRELADRLERAA